MVARLALIRRLVESGHAIGGVAQLPDEALQERLQAQAELNAAAPHQVAEAEQNIRLLVYGDFLPFSLDKGIEKMFPINVIGRHSVFGDFERDALALEAGVVLYIE
jgi:hypothetical protein